jgi:histidinol-phosphate aminotransferase
MNTQSAFSRRKFVGGLALAAGWAGLRPASTAMAQRMPMAAGGEAVTARICFNENPYGPPESVRNAMLGAMHLANQYDQPDGSNVLSIIASHHGVSPQNILLGAGSGEILNVVDATFLEDGKKVVGALPTFASVYEYARGMKSDSIQIPLRADHGEDIAATIKAVNDNAKTVGLVYVCNPNNPTGKIVTKNEIKQLLDGIPPTTPVLIDEAYHHFVENSEYATSIPYVTEGRPVIIARTFSKIVGLAGMRLGYAVASPQFIQRMTAHTTGTINTLVKYGGAAGIKDEAGQAKVKGMILETRKKTTGALTAMGYDVIPSDANFFMVHIKREISPVIAEFRQRGVQVGRPFPPMTQYMRVSVGTDEEMAKFTSAFKEIFKA